jgi:hypothetical protein
MGTERLQESELEAIIDKVFPEENTDEFGASEVEEVVEDEEIVDEDSEAIDDGQSDEDPEVEEEAETDESEEELEDEEFEDDDEDEEVLEDDEDTEDEDEDDDSDLLAELVTVKVNGEEMQVTVEQAVKGFQLASAANAKFEEASQLRKASQEAVEFKEAFDGLWSTNQTELVSHFVSIADDPNSVVEDLILRVAATGKLNSRIAEALGIDETTQKQLSVKYETEALENERAAAAAEREQQLAPQVDEHGYSVEDYQRAITDMLEASDMAKATEAEKRGFVEAVFKHGDDNGITNPYLAYAKYREDEVRKELKRTTRANKAVRKVSSSAKASSNLSPQGTRQHTPTKPKFETSEDAAAWALSEVEKKYGQSS